MELHCHPQLPGSGKGRSIGIVSKGIFSQGNRSVLCCWLQFAEFSSAQGGHLWAGGLQLCWLLSGFVHFAPALIPSSHGRCHNLPSLRWLKQGMYQRNDHTHLIGKWFCGLGLYSRPQLYFRCILLFGNHCCKPLFLLVLSLNWLTSWTKEIIVQTLQGFQEKSSWADNKIHNLPFKIATLLHFCGIADNASIF